MIGAFDHIYADNFLGAPAVNTHYVVLGFEALFPTHATLTPDDQHGELRWWTIEGLLSHPEVHENTKAYFRSV